MNIETRYINVFDKSGNFIAQFSNNTSANTDDAKKNLMASPTLHIVSNGESTLSFEMVASSEKWQQIKNPENIYECGGRYFTALNANSIVYNNKTVSVTLVETWYLLKKVFVQAHNVDTKIEALDEHTVKILPKTDKKFKLTVNGVSYDDSEVRDSRGVIMPRGSAGYALWAILKGTDWSLGVCDVLPDGFDAATDYGTFNVETDMKSALENIQFIQSLYGGILDWDSKNKVLNLRDERKKEDKITEEEFWADDSHVQNYGKKVYFAKSPIIKAENLIKGSKMAVKSYIEPVQEGSGDPSPENVRPIHGVTEVRTVHCGKNLFGNARVSTGQGYITIAPSGDIEFNNATDRVVYPNIECDLYLPAGTYSAKATVTGNPGRLELWVQFPQLGEYTWNAASENNAKTLTYGEKMQALVLVLQPHTSGTIKLQIEKGDVTTPYEPYHGETLTQALPEEVFGGAYEWDTGVLTSTHDSSGQRLPEPKTFQLEKHPIFAYEGINTLYSNTGDTDCKAFKYPDETPIKEFFGFNDWKGFEIRKGKNIASDPTVTWDNDIITRLYPLGNGNLNIRKVNGGKSYVENFSYTDRVYDGYLQNANIYDTGNESGQKTLKFWAERKLEKLSRPRKSIEYNDIIDLRAVPGHEFETFDVNDIVKAYYTDDITGKEVSEFVRVQEVSYNYFFPSSGSTVVVGDKVANEAEIFHQVYKRVESSTPTDQNGNISSDNVYIEIPDWMLPDFGYGSEFGDSYGYGTGYTSLSSITELHAYYEKQNKDDIVKTEAAVQVVADDLSAQQIAFTTFQKETADKFVQSSTQISQVSTDLKAQIELEANHYKETSAGITESNGKISIIANSLSAQIALEASHYRENSNSIASLRSYADSTFATNSLLASYETKSGVDNKISRSEASIKQYATKNFARVEIRADVDSIKEKTNGFNNVAGFVKVDAGSVTLGVERRGIAIAITPTWTVLYGTTTVSGSIDLGGDARINGKKISVDSRGFLKAN